MSVEDYLTLDRTSVEARYEYIDGYVYMLAGGMLTILPSALTSQVYFITCLETAIAVSITRT